MLTIALRSRFENGGDAAGALRQVGPHPVFLDYEARDVEQRWDRTVNAYVVETESIISIDFNNALAPVIVALHDAVGNESVSELDTALRFLRTAAADREDGIRLAELLISWARQWPQAAWEVTGSRPEIEILRSRSLRAHLKESAEAPRFVVKMYPEPDVDRLAAAHDAETCELGPDCRRCNGVDERTLQREERMTGHSGGGSRSGKKDRPNRRDRDAEYQRALQDDGSRTAFVGAKVSQLAKETLVTQRAPEAPSIGALLEKVATAIQSGATYAEVEAAIARAKRRRKGRAA